MGNYLHNHLLILGHPCTQVPQQLEGVRQGLTVMREEGLTGKGESEGMNSGYVIHSDGSPAYI